MPKITELHWEKLVQIFELDGFSVSGRVGDHIRMTKPGVRRPVVIKTSPRKVPPELIRINLTTAGMSRERYFELLNKVR